MISAKGIYKQYGTLQVLKGVDVDIEEGGIVAIVGKSGAGKSTLLHIIGGLDTPDRGELFLRGLRMAGLGGKSLADFRNQHIGFIFQFHHLLPEFTALENVSFPAWIGKMSNQKTAKRAKELLDYLGLAERMHHKPAQLSGGEAQRVAVARALINSPAVVLADEPSGNLDAQTSKELHSLFFRLRNDFNQTFVIVTHNNELAAMSDYTLQMVDGVLLPQSLTS